MNNDSLIEQLEALKEQSSPSALEMMVRQEINNALNIDRVDIAELPEGATVACNVTTLRKVAAFLQSLPKRESGALKESKDTLNWIKGQIEGDFMLDGKWVDNPSLLITSIHEEIENTLSKIEVQPTKEE